MEKGTKHTIKTRKNISKKIKEWWNKLSPETANRIKEFLKSSNVEKNGKDFNCIICNKKFYRAKWYFLQFPSQFCSLQCKGRFQSINKIMPPSRKGIKWSEEHKQKMSKIAKEKGIGKWMLGKILPLETRIKMGKAWIGEKNPNWKGGVAVLNKLSRMSYEYKKWESAVFKRDNYQCQICKKKEKLTAHHIKPFAFFPDLRFEVSNGKILCFDCHKNTDTYLKGRKIFL